MSPKLTTFPVFLAFLFWGASAHAAEMEEIVVTADFHQATEMELPESVSIVGRDVIEARAAQHLEELLGSVPNLNFAGGTGRSRFFQIRGIGERSEFADPVNPSVGLLVDHVDLSGAGSAATMLDVEQVEVLRGPQGTRYGANALAGLIKVKTNDPTDAFHANFSATAGNYDQREATAVVSGPLNPTVGGRLAIGKFESDGYTYNAFLDRDDVNYRDELTIRSKLSFEPNADHRTLLALSHIDVDNGYDVFSLDNTRTTLSDEPGRDHQESNAISIDSLWHTSAADIQLIAAASESDLDYRFDEDWTYVGFHPAGYSSTDAYLRDRRTRSMELRLLSPDGSGSDWVAGLYLLDSDTDLERHYTPLPGPFFSNYAFTSSAAFAQGDFRITDRFELSAGLRYERRATDYADSDDINFSPTDSMWGGQLSANYYASPSTLWYASLSRGYKAGGFNTDGSLDPDLREFDPEYLWELEAGVKATLLSGTMRLRGAIFYDARRDQQVKSSIVRVRPNGSTEFIDFLGNAAEGTNRGLELQVDWLVAEPVMLFANIGWLDAEFDEFINEFGEDLSGREQAQAPTWTASVGADIVHGNFFGRLSIDGKDSFFFSDRHNLTSDDYVLVNARVGYRSGPWTLSAWGRNLTDQDVFIRGFGSFGNDPRKDYAVEPYRQFGEPRVFGFTFDYEL